MKKILMKIFLAFGIFSICFIFNVVNVNASEIGNDELIEEYAANALAASENEDGSNKVNFNERFNSYFYSPVLNYFYGTGNSKLSYSGRNYMLFFRQIITGNSCIFTGGNIIYKSFDDSCYPIYDDCYSIASDGMLLMENGVVNLGYNPYPIIANCISSSEPISGKQAALYCYNNADKLSDPDYLTENNLEDFFIYKNWTTDGEFNPWVDGSDNRENYKVVAQPSGIEIPSDISGCYVDYLVSDSTYTFFKWYRCYYNHLFGNYSLNEFENMLPHKSVTYDNILVLGVGTYTVSNSSELPTGLTQAPNLIKSDVEHKIIGWTYNQMQWSVYNTRDVFINSSCEEYFIKNFIVDASTSKDDISQSVDTDKEHNTTFDKILNYLGLDWLKDFGSVFDTIGSYINSIGNVLSSFSSMISVVFGWMPKPLYNLIIVALTAFVAILFIKLLLHLL